MNTRYTYLSEQRDDVEKAKEELTGIIDEITRADDGDLRRAVQAAQRELSGDISGAVRRRQGHGWSWRTRTTSWAAASRSRCSPRARQLKTITLLSGGEKAFVAIALYFAILKVHPTPFCVMDEIEAALDDANVVRYARYMRRMAGQDAVHRHHPPPGHHGGGRRAVRRHHAGAGRQPRC